MSHINTNSNVLTVGMFLSLSIYIIGSYIQLKIISVCRIVKDKTWQMDITNSVAAMVSFFFIMIFEIITDHVPLLSQYIGGVWICYIPAFIYVYSAYLIGFHSLSIAFAKYMYIVHNDKVTKYGEEKLRRLFFSAYLIHPLLLTIPTLLTFDLEAFSSLISCFGLQEQLMERYNTSSGNIEKMFLCKLGGEVDEYSYTFKQCFCALKMIWVLFLSCNIPEGYLYYKIFKKMRR